LEAQPTPWLILSIAAGAADRSIVRPEPHSAKKESATSASSRSAAQAARAGPGSSAHERPNRKRPRRSGSHGAAEMIDSLEAFPTTRLKQ